MTARRNPLIVGETIFCASGTVKVAEHFREDGQMILKDGLKYN